MSVYNLKRRKTWKKTCACIEKVANNIFVEKNMFFLHQVLLKVIAFFGRIENYSLSLYLWVELINGKQIAAVR